MKIVTKRGDKGKTSNLKGERISKDSAEVQFLGDLDELQSFLGIIKEGKNSIEIEEIQFQIYHIMSGDPGDVELLDGYIKSLTIPDIKYFILPSGWIHVCRTVARRAERSAVAIQHPSIQFLNRLSDYLYILSFN